MIAKDIKELKTTSRDLRKFGLLVGGVFVVLGLIWWARGKPYFAWALAPGAVLLALGLIWPRALKYVYIVWMSLAIVLGYIVSTVLLTIFFFLVITPIGLIARLAGKDFLSLKLNRQAPTYWLAREGKSPKTPADYERQF
jgi:polyferredoxin